MKFHCFHLIPVLAAGLMISPLAAQSPDRPAPPPRAENQREAPQPGRIQAAVARMVELQKAGKHEEARAISQRLREAAKGNPEVAKQVFSAMRAQRAQQPGAKAPEAPQRPMRPQVADQPKPPMARPTPGVPQRPMLRPHAPGVQQRPMLRPHAPGAPQPPMVRRGAPVKPQPPKVAPKAPAKPQCPKVAPKAPGKPQCPLAKPPTAGSKKPVVRPKVEAAKLRTAAPTKAAPKASEQKKPGERKEVKAKAKPKTSEQPNARIVAELQKLGKQMTDLSNRVRKLESRGASKRD